MTDAGPLWIYVVTVPIGVVIWMRYHEVFEVGHELS